MKIIKDHDWDKLRKEYKDAKPFPSICIDDFLDIKFANSLVKSYPKYSEARTIGREFSSLNENLKTQITDPNDFPDPVKLLSQALSEPGFIDNISTLTGIKELIWDPDFSGGGIHLTNTSGLLDVHVDFNFETKLNLYRRLNILIYLNPTWEKKWGGQVELWDKDVQDCIQSFEPVFNRCILFTTSDYSFHGVNAVNSPENISRNSFAAYYYTKEAGDNSGEVYGGHHTTIFKARPSEKIKKYWLMPKKKLETTLAKSKKELKSRVKKLIN